MSDNPEDEKPAVSEAVLAARGRARAALPATYVDTWYTLTWKDHIRIVFAEWLEDDPYFRAAFIMELKTAKEFAEELLDIVTKRIAEDAENISDQPPKDE